MSLPTRTFHIQLAGKVQGVGFRPFVYRLAVEARLAGTVRNGSDGVHIHFSTGIPQARRFYRRLLREAPAAARITAHRMEEVGGMQFDGFRIISSSAADGGSGLLPASDIAICPACLADTRDPGGRRRGYPFTSCTACGPRYGIQEKIPFDRRHTTLAGFDLCPACRAEYRSASDRRFHAQTISCPRCAIRLGYVRTAVAEGTGQDKARKESDDGTAHLCAVVDDLLSGGIVAVKGPGGYLLLCDATQGAAVSRLRDMKCRPDKPFAVMYREPAQLEQDVRLSKEQRNAFLSPAGPVVLCPLREVSGNGLATDAIAPGLPNIGAMRPATALLDQILAGCGRPLVATSANAPGCPLHHTETGIRTQFGGQVTGILSDNLPLLFGQDDSVVGFSTRYGRRIVFRRGRGFAPSLLRQPFADWREPVLAMGADRKSTLCLHQDSTTLLSQALGDLGYLEAQENHRACREHLLALTGAQPATILVDRHPDYHSARMGRALAASYGPKATVVAVPHHAAHFAAILAEHGCLRSDEPTLGVIWDGAGWGEDGQIWGGEFLTYHRGSFDRLTHLDVFPWLFGDRMAREPRLAALAACSDVPGADALLRGKFPETDWDRCQRYLRREPERRTSSMGRLFDAAAALLGFESGNTYEGAAAAYLEHLAARALAGGYPEHGYPGPFDRVSLLGRMVADLRQPGASRPAIALRFHLSLAHWVLEIADRYDYRHIACSGGVFQNNLLTDLLTDRCPDGRRLYFHRELPPNDENIAFGQLAYLYATTVVRSGRQVGEVAAKNQGG